MPTLLTTMSPAGDPRESKATGNGLQKTSIGGQVWALASRDQASSRSVQAVIEDAAGSDNHSYLLWIAAEMRGHVWEAVHCPNANHVLQKVITEVGGKCGPESVQFIIDELLGRRPTYAALQACRHKFACRIPQRLMEVCHPSQVERLVQGILTDARSLCTHQFGNYVIQHILDFGTECQVQHILKMLQENAKEMMANDVASLVLTKAYQSNNIDLGSKAALARVLLQEQDLFCSMACSRSRHQAAKLTIEVLENPGRRSACHALSLSGHLRRLKASSRGRALASIIECYLRS